MHKRYLFGFVFTALAAVILAALMVWTFAERLLGVFILVFIVFIIDVFVCNDFYEHFDH